MTSITRENIIENGQILSRVFPTELPEQICEVIYVNKIEMEYAELYDRQWNLNFKDMFCQDSEELKYLLMHNPIIKEYIKILPDTNCREYMRNLEEQYPISRNKILTEEERIYSRERFINVGITDEILIREMQDNVMESIDENIDIINEIINNTPWLRILRGRIDGSDNIYRVIDSMRV